jgi:hypothetical protein
LGESGRWGTRELPADDSLSRRESFGAGTGTLENRVIDVRSVIAHSLWILGVAVVLAAFSYYDWWAREGRRRRDVFRSARGWKMSLAGGLLLIASGFLLMEGTHWWARGLWLLVWAGAAFGLWRTPSAT